jgi:hypothetical protein
MRYIFASGALLSTVAVVATMMSSPSAVAQQANNRFVPVPLGGAGAGYVVRQHVDFAEAGGEETAELSARDAQLGHEAESLAKQLADASDEKQKSEIKEKLQDTLSRQFDAQQKAREVEVTRIEAKVKKLRETITKRNEARRTIIDKRFDQLLSEAEGLGWNSPPSGAGFGTVYIPQTTNAYVPQTTTGNAPGRAPVNVRPTPVGR